MSDNESEMDIVKYLGFNNIDELVELLAKTSVGALRPGVEFIYNSAHYFEINKVSKNYEFDIKNKNNDPEFSINNKSIVYNNGFDLNPIKNTELPQIWSHVGWRCVLNYNEKNNGSYKRTSTYKKTAKKCDPLDCGHILGLGLFKYIESRKILKNQKIRTDDGQKLNNKKLRNICNDADNNLFPQFPRANRNSKLDVGQLRFEELVINYLIHKHDERVYYEVEKIYFNPSFDIENGGIPIGTRIFASAIDKCSGLNSEGKLALPFHVFIPNYAVSSSEWQSGNENYDLDNLLENDKSKIRELYGKFYGHNWNNSTLRCNKKSDL